MISSSIVCLLSHMCHAIIYAFIGIPEEKKGRLFNKYQESLDVLSQGTGIGLFLCKSLVELMGGKIFLDDTYDSGIEGSPGSRFVVKLYAQPIDIMDRISKETELESLNSGGTANLTYEGDSDNEHDKLPEKLSVLFVDDDAILRKLFSRTVRTVAPGWTIREASNGETALQLVEDQKFDLIFSK